MDHLSPSFECDNETLPAAGPNNDGVNADING